MLRRIRSLLIVVFAAAVGAALGRAIAEARRRQEDGEEVTAMEWSSVRVRVADLVPGLVAAVRVHDQPWSWMRIPSWTAALTVNMAVGAVGGNVARLREIGERAAFDFAGVDFSDRSGQDEQLRYHMEQYDAEPDPHAPAPGERWIPLQASEDTRRDPGLDDERIPGATNEPPGQTSLHQ